MERKIECRNSYKRLTLYILVTSIILYAGFIFGGKVFVYRDWGYDTFHQYVPVMEFAAENIKEGSLSQYTFQYGFGENMFHMIAWFADPFTMISVMTGVIFGTDKIAASLVYVQILKNLCSGLLALHYLKNFGYSDKSSMLAAYIYAFSGYITAAGQHYAFGVLPVYNILMLIAIEKVLKSISIKNILLITAAAAMICIKDVYFAYQIFLGAAFYTLFRLICINRKNIKKFLCSGAAILSGVISGMFLSAFMFLPQAESLLSSNRIETQTLTDKIRSAFTPASNQIITSCLARLFSLNIEGTVNDWSGGEYHWQMFSCFFSVMLIPFAAQFIWKTIFGQYSLGKKAARLLPAAVVIFAVFMNFIPQMFNGFQYPIARYAFVWLPLFTVMTADVLDDIFRGNFCRPANYVSLCYSVAFIIAVAFRTYKISGRTTTFFTSAFAMCCITFGCLLLDLLFLSSRIDSGNELFAKFKKTVSIMFCGVIAFNLFGENITTLYLGRNIVSQTTEEKEMVTDTLAAYVNAHENDRFVRTETVFWEDRMPDHTYSLLFPLRGISTYNTTLDSHLCEFLEKMQNISSNYQYRYREMCSADRNSVEEDVLGIKYLFSNEEYTNGGWEKTASTNSVNIYKNEDLNSAGLLFNTYISENDADKMSKEERLLGVGKQVILDVSENSILGFADNTDLKGKPEEEISDVFDLPNTSAWMGSNINISDVAGNSASITLDATKETSLTIPLKKSSDEIFNSDTLFTVSVDKAVPIKYLCWKNEYVSWSGINSEIIESNETDNIYRFNIPKEADIFAIAIDYEGTIRLNITYSNMEINYVTEGIDLYNPGRGSTIYGSVSAQKDSIFYMPVPFSSDWTAELDGQNVPIIKANYGFMAICMPAGEHSVKFVYDNKAFRFGCVVSAATAGLLILSCAIYFVKQHKAKGKK